MGSQSVLCERDGAVELLTLNRPRKKNAFNDDLWDGLSDALRQARDDDEVSVAVVTGAGGDFSAGQDVEQWEDRSAEREDGQSNGYPGCMDALYSFDKPLLAAVRGVGVGIGCTFLFGCDLVYVGESVRLRLPFVSLGLVPEAASTVLLPANIGAQRAAELFFTAEWIGARRAVEVGIAARSFPDELVLDATLAKAREIARWPLVSLRSTKRILMAHREGAVRAARAAEDAAMRERVGSPEHQEAIRAFMERREPDFLRLRGGSALAPEHAGTPRGPGGEKR